MDLIKAGDKVRIKAEWREKDEPAIEYVAMDDEDPNGVGINRIGISPVEWEYKIRPIETVEVSMLEKVSD